MATTRRKVEATAATATTEVRVSKFADILARSNASIREDRARRIAEAVSDAQDKIIMDMNAEIRKRENELDAMMDLSTSNLKTSMNVISPDFDAESYVKKINQLYIEIETKRMELEIIKEVKADLF
jgi:hypothetical protein